MSSFEYKVYYCDTDAGGVVYYATYLHFLEKARTDFLEKTGITSKNLHSKGIFFAVKSVKADYLKPVFYGDTIKIEVFVKEVRKASFNLGYKIFKDNKIVFIAETVLVCIDKEFNISKLPSNIQNFLTKEARNV